MEYKAVYKCLRCGVEFEGDKTYYTDNIDDVYEWSDRLAHDDHWPVKLELHCCTSSRYMGMGYLVGFNCKTQQLESIGKNIKRIIKEKGIKEIDVCNQVGISPSMMSQYISGRRIPKYERVCQIARALGASPSDIDGRLKDL